MSGRRDARLRLVAISDGLGDVDRLAARLEALFAAGLRCVQLREAHWSAATLAEACRRLLPSCERHAALLLVNATAAAAGGVPLPQLRDLVGSGLAHGLQIGRRTGEVADLRDRLGPTTWLGYSAHDPSELATAHSLGCDFALLSPVWSTASKPGQPPLGVRQAADWTNTAALPVLWLGGVAPATCQELATLPTAARPFGLAAIRCCWADDGPAAVAALLGLLGR
jgi:thiamine-phosphate diphosphorylase